MKMLTHTLECISPCFCAGALPDEQAEIRASSIRGQLRWWFRALGGFCVLEPIPLRTQEKHVFGSSEPQNKFASPLGVRVKRLDTHAIVSSQTIDADGMGASAGSDRGYLLFPLQSNPQKKKSRAVISGPPWTRFQFEITWGGDSALWESVQALAAVFIHLGAIGFRSRRAMGAIACVGTPPLLAPALQCFSASNALRIKMMPAKDSSSAVAALGKWLRKWRSYGRSAGRQFNSFQPGFQFAQKDHDSGLKRFQGPAYRPAIGLPISQSYSSHATVEWAQRWNHQKHQGEGRFASPILLRPYRNAENQWIALVIFVNTKQWPSGGRVFIDGQSKPVSLDLFHAMKEDPALQNFTIQ